MAFEKKYTRREQDEAMRIFATQGCRAAQKATGMSESLIRYWGKKRGVSPTKKVEIDRSIFDFDKEADWELPESKCERCEWLQRAGRNVGMASCIGICMKDYVEELCGRKRTVSNN